MAERTRRPSVGRLCLVLFGGCWSGRLGDAKHGTPSHWALAEVTLVMAGLCSCTASSKAKGEFEEEWTEFQPSDGAVDQTLLGGRQVRRIPISVRASAVTPWCHPKCMRDSKAHPPFGTVAG